MTLSKSELNYSEEEILKLKIALTKGWDEELKLVVIEGFVFVDGFIDVEIRTSMTKLTEEHFYQKGIELARACRMRFDDPEFGRF